MISKEVEEATEQLKKYIKEPITTTTDERMGYTKIKTKFHIPSEKNIETVLDYISELEEENKTQRGQLNSAFDNGFIHKDKIRDELKEFKDKAKTAKGIELLLLEANINLLERILAGK